MLSIPDILPSDTKLQVFLVSPKVIPTTIMVHCKFQNAQDISSYLEDANARSTVNQKKHSINILIKIWTDVHATPEYR